MALDILDELAAVAGTLTTAGIDYAVCGGLALAIHGFERMTNDIDILIRGEDVASALALVKPLGFDVPAKAMTFGLKAGTPRPVQRISKIDPGTGVLLSLDLLHVTPDLSQVWADRELIEWGGQKIRVVSRSGLVTMKRIAGRPQDLMDIHRLEFEDDDE